jgi:hypothetical protein
VARVADFKVTEDEGRIAISSGALEAGIRKRGGLGKSFSVFLLKASYSRMNVRIMVPIAQRLSEIEHPRASKRI